MKRFHDWPERLAAFVQDRRRRPFAWGTNDCVSVAADWVEACTGERVIELGHTDEASAAAAIAERGGLRAAVESVMGQPLANPLTMQRGDVVLFESDRGPALGVCIGAEFVAQGARGLIAYPMTAAVCAWRVGDA